MIEIKKGVHDTIRDGNYVFSERGVAQHLIIIAN